MLPKTLSDVEITKFQKEVWDYYRDNVRPMPWRQQPEPYFVLVSELMLQQTQVSRVIPKFEEFIAAYPDIASLANAPLGGVLIAWSGLGYNRRAKFLWAAAQHVVRDFDGELPATKDELMSLPGVGPNTAGAILAYAFEQPAVYVETNIRTVLLHHFFADSDEKITDSQLLSVVSQTLDSEHPREWYWALMDYGAYLKRTAGGKLDQSAGYRKQAPLEGSVRQMRGRIIRILTSGSLNGAQLREAVKADERFARALQALIAEGMVVRQGSIYSLTPPPNTR